MSYIAYRWAMAQIGGWGKNDLDQSIERTTRRDPPFYGVVMLAMQRADTINLIHLRAAWPDVYDELHARYNAPGALLPSDPAGLKEKIAATFGTTVEALTREIDETDSDHFGV